MTRRTEPGDGVLDRATFDGFAGLFDDDEMRDVVEQWHADSECALAAMADARQSGDLARIGEIAHRAAGGAMAIGAIALADACERLRNVAQSGAPVGEDATAPVREAVAATYAALTAATRRG